MENIRYKPNMLAILLDLSEKHTSEVNKILQRIMFKLETDDLCLFCSFSDIHQVMVNAASQPDYRVHLIAAVDFYNNKLESDVLGVRNDLDLDFYFCKIGKHNENLEKAVKSHPRGYYFNNMEDLMVKVRELTGIRE